MGLCEQVCEWVCVSRSVSGRNTCMSRSVSGSVSRSVIGSEQVRAERSGARGMERCDSRYWSLRGSVCGYVRTGL